MTLEEHIFYKMDVFEQKMKLLITDYVIALCQSKAHFLSCHVQEFQGTLKFRFNNSQTVNVNFNENVAVKMEQCVADITVKTECSPVNREGIFNDKETGNCILDTFTNDYNRTNIKTETNLVGQFLCKNRYKDM